MACSSDSGTDSQGMPALAERQGAQLAKLTRYFEPWEVLKIATSQNYEIFKRSGPRDPYPGDNGVVREGAYADLLLVDGNPLENIELIADPHRNFVIIMKDGCYLQEHVGIVGRYVSAKIICELNRWRPRSLRAADVKKTTPTRQSNRASS